jgi:pimeloyl-ACP methyl ester carboxylesterase
MAGLARALERLLDAIAAPRVVLLGHSMGGMLAQEAVIAFPRKVAGLVLSATSPAFGKPDGGWQQEFLRQRLGPLDAGKTMADLAPALVRDRRRKSKASGARPNHGARRRHLPQALGARRLRPRGARLNAVSARDAGERDATAPPAVMEDGESPGAGTRSSGLRHLANLERPRAFDDAVLGWLARRFPH